MLQIIPGVLEKDWESIETKLETIKSFSRTVHVDIIDGVFVDNKTFLDPTPFKKYSEILNLELHMMVEEPINIIDAWASAGFKRFLGHIEHMSSQKEFVAAAKKYGEVGLALDGPTHIQAIKVPYDDLDSILIYTSHRVGFSGPPLMEDRLDKIRHLRKLTNIPIEVDGGINDKSIERAKAAGATRFVTTSYLFGNGNPHEKYTHLQSLLGV
ncbi:MAG TPA: hypothetical protein VG965_03785 [Patescibacteria group bacterium]|nr:hypothetical protein [Patescibacteria group bacterium]